MSWAPPERALLNEMQVHVAKAFAGHSVVHFVVPTRALSDMVARLHVRIVPFLFIGGPRDLARLKGLSGGVVLHPSLVGHPDYEALRGITRGANAEIERARARLFGGPRQPKVAL